MNVALDAFGNFVMKNLRDPALEFAELALAGKWKAPRIKKLQAELKDLNEEQRALIRRVVRSSVDSAIHDFLFAIQKAHDLEQGTRVVVAETNVAAVSDGLHGEPFGEDGWQARFSKFGQAPDTR
jgi:hypothetical protein